MEADKVPTNKFLQAVMDVDDTESDNSALYYSAVENSTSLISNDDSTLEADHDVSLEKTMENTVKHTKTPNMLNSPAFKRMANSPLLLSGRKQVFKQLAVASTPNLIPDNTRGTENDINAVNNNKWSKLTLDFASESSEKVDQVEIVNQKLEEMKLEYPLKANWRFTSPSNPAYAFDIPKIEKEKKKPSPGQIQFQKAITRVSMECPDEDLSLEKPPMTGRPSMVIDDFEPMKELFRVKTPSKPPMIVETDTESDISPEEVRQPKTLEHAFEKMAAGMANSSIDEMCSKDEINIVKESKLPKRTSISTKYRTNVITKANSVPGPINPTQIPPVKKRATWASRKPTTQLSEIPESKPVLVKRTVSTDFGNAGPSKPIMSRKSFLPTTRQTEVLPTKKRQSLHPASLKPTMSSSVRKEEADAEKSKTQKTPAQKTLKIANVKVGNRRSSFGQPVGKPNIRKSMLPSRASPKPSRRTIMPPPSTSSLARTQSQTGAIPKQSVVKNGAKTELMCKYCDKKFAIVKALDDHLLLKCPKIPPKAKKALLTESYEARELETVRKLPSNRSSKNIDPMESSGASSSSLGSGLSAPRSIPKITRTAPHSGVVHTPNKQIVCMACGKKFSSAVNYSIHITEHEKTKNGEEAEQVNENEPTKD